MSKKERSYEDWLVGQKELAKEAYEFVKSFGLDVRLIDEGGRRSLVHITVNSDQSMFLMVKEIKSCFVREIWVCKTRDIQSNTGFLIHSAKEGAWLFITSREVQARGEKKPSSYQSGGEYYVVKREYFAKARGFFRRMKKTIESRKQRRLGDYV